MGAGVPERLGLMPPLNDTTPSRLKAREGKIGVRSRACTFFCAPAELVCSPHRTKCNMPVRPWRRVQQQENNGTSTHDLPLPRMGLPGAGMRVALAARLFEPWPVDVKSWTSSVSEEPGVKPSNKNGVSRLGRSLWEGQERGWRARGGTEVRSFVSQLWRCRQGAVGTQLQSVRCHLKQMLNLHQLG